MRVFGLAVVAALIPAAATAADGRFERSESRIEMHSGGARNGPELVRARNGAARAQTNRGLTR